MDNNNVINPATGLSGKTTNPNIISEDDLKTMTPYKGEATFAPRVGIPNSQYNSMIPESAFYDPNILRETIASNQPWHHELGNFLGQLAGTIVGDSVAGFGHLADLTRGQEEALVAENELVKFGESISQLARDTMPIYQGNPDGFALADREAFFNSMVSIGSTLAMLIPSQAALSTFKLLSKTAGMNKVIKLAKKHQFIADGIGQAMFSRHIESSMEMSQLYDELIQEGYDQKQALEAAKDVYNKNWVMLLQDIPQYLAIGKIFNPMTGGYVDKTVKKASRGKKIAQGVMVPVSEGFEEAYQYVISQNAKHAIDVLNGGEQKSFEDKVRQYGSDNEFWNSVVAGAAGGAIFQAVGPALNNMTNFSRRAYIRQLKAAQAAFLEKRGVTLNGLLNQIQEADETGDPYKADEARRAYNHVRTLEALITGKFDSHIEFLEQMGNLDEEALDNMRDGKALKVAPEKVKELTQTLIKEAHVLREHFFKYINAGYSDTVAASIAEVDMNIDNYSDRLAQVGKEYNEAKAKHLSNTPLSGHGDTLYEKTVEKLGLEQAVATLHLLNSLQADPELETTAKALTKKLEGVNKELEKLNEEDTRTPEEKAQDKAVLDSLKLSDRQDGDNRKYEDIVRVKKQEALYQQYINKARKEKQYLMSAENQKQAAKKELSKRLESVTTQKQYDEIKKQAEEEFGMPAAAFDKFAKPAQEKILKIRQEMAEGIAKKMATAAENNTQPEYTPEEADFLLDPDNVELVNAAFASIINDMETENGDFDEPDPNDPDNDDYDGPDFNAPEDTKKLIGVHPRLMFVPENGVYTAWNDWMLNSKVDKTQFRLRYSFQVEPIHNTKTNTTIHPVNTSSTNAFFRVEVIHPDGTPLIHRYTKDGKIVEEPVWTTLYATDANLMEKEYREMVFNALQKGLEVTSDIHYVAPLPINNVREKGKPAEFTITEVFGQEPALVTIDREGYFIDMNGKRVAAYGTVNKKNSGIFFVRERNNQGRLIPIKLNRKKLSFNQAKVVADLVELILNNPDKNFLKQSIEKASADIIANMEELFGEDFLDIVRESTGENKTPSVIEVLDFFVYLTPNRETVNSMLFGDNKLHVGTKEDGFTISKENFADNKNKLLDFLTTHKRFNVKIKGLKQAGYFTYVTQNKLLNTDVKPGEIFVKHFTKQSFKDQFPNNPNSHLYYGEMYASNPPIIDGKPSPVKTSVPKTRTTKPVEDDDKGVDLTHLHSSLKKAKEEVMTQAKEEEAPKTEPAVKTEGKKLSPAEELLAKARAKNAANRQDGSTTSNENPTTQSEDEDSGDEIC